MYPCRPDGSRRHKRLQEAREWQDEAGRFRFRVAIRAPLIGAIIRYTGWLVPVSP